MKIVMFTPTLRESAIGRMACLITRELVDSGHDVAIVRSEDENLLCKATHDFELPLVAWNERQQVAILVSRADMIIYQIGNHFPFHRGCLEWIPWRPGIVCLHDFYLGHLFHSWAETRQAQAELILRKWYGKGAVESFFQAASGPMFIEETRDLFPMTEWICAMACGVITHSKWGVDRAIRACRGPVRAVPLAYSAGTVDASLERRCSNSGYRRINILTVGHVNSNKRIASVIRAIGASELMRGRSVYRIVGSIQPRVLHELSALARNYGVRLRISGEVGEAELLAAFHEADIVSCLRWPSLEAASASAIEAMLHGKAIVVTDTGFYRELPDDCVIKVDPGNEAASLREALEQLTEDDDLRAGLGKRAKAWAEETFTAKNYAQQLVDMGREASLVRPPIEATAYLRQVVATWGGGDALMDQMICSMNLPPFGSVRQEIGSPA